MEKYGVENFVYTDEYKEKSKQTCLEKYGVEFPSQSNSYREKYKNNLPSLISLATGPSRTADIEKTLVVGVHGPKEVFCFLVDKQ